MKVKAPDDGAVALEAGQVWYNGHIKFIIVKLEIDADVGNLASLILDPLAPRIGASRDTKTLVEWMNDYDCDLIGNYKDIEINLKG